MTILREYWKAVARLSTVYKFKVFKKTTKFKRYNRGLTKFIINRKKNVLRKKRSSLQFVSHLTHFWTLSYSSLRGSIRFSQNLNMLKYSGNLINTYFMDKLHTKDYNLSKSSIWDYSYITASISKNLFFNASLFQKTTRLTNLFLNTRAGFIFVDEKNSELLDTICSSVFNSHPAQYSDINSSGKVNFLLSYNFFFKKAFLHNVFFAKTLRKILVLATLLRL